MKFRLTPWPSRAHRKADIAAAHREAAVSRKDAQFARKIELDLLRMAEDNHFAELIYAAITGRDTGNSRK